MESRPELLADNLPATVPAGSIRHAHVRLAGWTSGELRLTLDGRLVGKASMPALQVEDDATLSFGWRAPTGSGTAVLQLHWYAPSGVTAMLLKRKLHVAPTRGDRSERWSIDALRHDPWAWQPSASVRFGAGGGRYPLCVASARGGRFRDPDGHEWIDWVCGWGACLLGYAEPRIAAAVAVSLQTTAASTLPDARAVTLAARLEQLLPGAEATIFGKNGSDVCTAAVRVARVFTGRPSILHSGYHGWQDWYVAGREAAVACPEPQPKTHALPRRDAAALDEALAAHRGQVAAVMLEPAAAIEGIDGPIRPADAGFLRHAAVACREAGALLVFDEIFTGFRHPSGSVQAHVGVKPDLTCLGKALSAGFPLAALVGRRDVLESAVPRIAYHPTFQREPHALAAAAQALQIYATEDVPARVEHSGRELQACVAALARRHNLAIAPAGVPYRWTLCFESPEPERTYRRTYVQQQLLLRGVLTFRGLILPSTAHDAEDVSLTATAFDAAFAGLRRLIDAGRDLLPELEIPLVC